MTCTCSSRAHTCSPGLNGRRAAHAAHAELPSGAVQLSQTDVCGQKEMVHPPQLTLTQATCPCICDASKLQQRSQSMLRHIPVTAARQSDMIHFINEE